MPITTYPQQIQQSQGALLAYAITTTSQTGISAEVPLTGLQVTVNIPAGRVLRITGAVRATGSAANSGVALYIFDVTANTYLQSGPNYNPNASLAMQNTVTTILSPTAGTHTYRLTGQVSGTGTVDITSGVQNPSWLMVEDITGFANPYGGQAIPVGVLGQAQVTANQGPVTTTATLTGLSVNATVPAGRTVRVTLKGEIVGTTGDVWVLSILDGATALQRQTGKLVGTASESVEVAVIVSPSAGSHTYTVTLQLASGTGVTFGAAATYPAFLLVEDITATPAPANTAPSSTLAYAEVTANQNPITAPGPTDLTGLSVTVTVVAGRRLKITGHGQVSYTDTTTGVYVDVLEDGVDIGRVYLGGYIPNAAAYDEMDGSIIRSPAAGTHTYKLTATRYVGAGSGILSASAGNTAFLMVEDVTGAAVASYGFQSMPAATIASEAWTSYTGTTPVPTSGAFTTVSGSGAYIKLGRTVHYRYTVTTTTIGTASGDIRFDLPVSCNTNHKSFGYGREDGIAGDILVVYPFSATQVQIRVPSAMANGKIYDVTGTYEAVS
jgi:hypothetical protein